MGDFLISLCTVSAGAIVTACIGLIFKKIIEKKIDKKEAERAELETLRDERRREERKKDVLETFNRVLQPIEEKVDNISSNLEKNTRGTVTLLRERMEQSHDRFIKRGWISANELANWRHLYNTYVECGGNHFREYVEEWKNDVENLPREKQENNNEEM